jgi:hypothetical protein
MGCATSFPELVAHDPVPSEVVAEMKCAALDADSDGLALVAAIVQWRGVDPGASNALVGEFQLYKTLRAARDAPGKFLFDIPATDTHWGSRPHLQFGSIVCEYTDLKEPIFGALLNPTGGIVGPGACIERYGCGGSPAAGGALVAHTVVHDAYGYLRVYHGVGPGYMYMCDSSPSCFATNLLCGHCTGLVGASCCR